MSKIKISVSQEDIDNGTPGDETCCPIALAVKRQYPEYNEVSVEIDVLFLDDINYLMPIEASNFVDDFDEGKSVAPLEFEIDSDWDEY